MGMFEHPNAALVERLYAAFDAGDKEALKKLIAEDAVWHVPGSTEISGDHRGHEAVFAYFQKLTELSGGTYRAELVDVLASDMHAAALAAAIGERGDRVLEQTYLLFLRIENDRIVEARLFNEDEEAFQAFWS
ncbi:MAG TPA: nuclear transport factor 2 family protein [Thermoplasmata archaeon]|nr:nuclear transport factor 2 family protein [Thermoplasmata archaeon]